MKQNTVKSEIYSSRADRMERPFQRRLSDDKVGYYYDVTNENQ